MHPDVEAMIARGHCICAPRGLSVDPRCPIHKNEATNTERRRYGVPQRPHYCPVNGQMCERPECSYACEGPKRTAAAPATAKTPDDGKAP